MSCETTDMSVPLVYEQVCLECDLGHRMTEDIYLQGGVPKCPRCQSNKVWQGLTGTRPDSLIMKKQMTNEQRQAALDDDIKYLRYFLKCLKDQCLASAPEIDIQQARIDRLEAALSAPAVPVIEDKVWVDIPEYEGIYQISDCGDVRVVKTGLIKKQCKNQKGYLCVGLTKDKISKTQRVHRLMAISFLNASDKDVTNHIDGNKQNNNLDNLELVSMRENTTHGYNSSGKTGSILDKESGRWIASIKINGQNVYLGRYATQEQAHQAYLNALEENCIQNKYAYAALPKMQKVDLDDLANVIRTVDGENTLGAGALAEKIKSEYGELYAEVK